nr:HAMP domain-containing sensor histidine kinase [Actinopolymorpha rutila]
MARLTVSRALEPVDRMAGQAAEWSAHDVTQRFGTAARPDELAALAASLDGLLDRLSAVLRHERQLSAELSHELRTPLAHIAAETELLIGRRRSADELARAHVAIRDSTDRMRRIIETLLLAARDGRVDAPGRCAVNEVLASMVARHRATGEVSLTLSVEPSRLYCGVSTDILERIVSPVLDNAVRYAFGQVRLNVRRKEDLLEIEVGDDGPGLARGAAELAFTAGWRGDPADLHDGAGLGLPLARRLARSVGGEVEHLPSEHGAAFVIRLPSG